MAKGEKSSSAKEKRYPWLKIPQPTVRALQVYAIDPSTGNFQRNYMTVHVPWEPLDPGPDFAGDRARHASHGRGRRVVPPRGPGAEYLA